MIGGVNPHSPAGSRDKQASLEVEIVIFDGVDELDVVGPYEVLTAAARHGAKLTVRLVVAPGRPHKVVAAHGLNLQADAAMSEGAELIVVPGGGWADRSPVGVRAEIEGGELPRALAGCHRQGATVAAVCTGAMALAAAGLLEGRPAVTHHAALDDLAAAGAAVVSGRVVDDGDVVTCGGVTSGIDLGLHLLTRFFGTEVADAVAARLEYPHRPAAGPAAAVTLSLHAGGDDLWICRLDPATPIPDWAGGAGWTSVTRTAEELSIVCPLAELPDGIPTSGPWRALHVAGPLSHDLTGVLSSIATPLSQAAIPIFAVSSYDTDHVLVPARRLTAAVTALRVAGHTVSGP